MCVPIRVLVVDDHESLRNSFEREFCPENGFEIVGSLACAALVEAECAVKRPDVVILDVCTEGGASGLGAAALILEKYPDMKVIVTTGFDEITYAPRARALGVHAFLYKSKSLGDFREAVRRVLAGETVFPEPRRIPVAEGESPLTDREMEILRLMCKHMSGKKIAEELFLSERTVKYHKANMLAKTGFDNGLDLAFYVVSNGWINPNF
ncbi:MAG: response regulator transcription factor [Clostridiales bacterium]|nr:response regulator transcription factor [Clostridiales bacterium]